MAATARAGLRYPALTDTPDVVRDIQNLATDADGVLVMYAENTFANRPAAGKHGRLFYATDQQTLYYDYGTGWLNLTPSVGLADGSVTLLKLAANSVDSSKIVDGSITSADILDGTITGADLAAALHPSQGAGAAVEALRALGTAAGMAAAGSHAAQHGRTAADPLVGTPVYAQQEGSKTHIETGVVSMTDSGSGANATFTFAVPFTAAPMVFLTPVGFGMTFALGTVTVNNVNVLGTGGGTHSCNVLAIGPNA